MHFSLYLKKRGLISAEQLVSALDVQLSALVPIGQLALEENMLTPRDVFSVLLAQSDAPHELFGDMAIEMRLLTRDEVTRLLMIQADRKRPIADILVGQGVITQPQLEAELTCYRREQLQPRRPSATVKFVPMPRGRMAPRHVMETVTAV